jgi:hypothetical protein
MSRENCQNFHFQTVKIPISKMSKFPFLNCQNFLFQTVKISLFKLSKFPFPKCQNFPFLNCQNFHFQTVKISFFKLSKFQILVSCVATLYLDLEIHLSSQQSHEKSATTIKSFFLVKYDFYLSNFP